MSTTGVRVATKRRLVDLFTSAVTDAAVSYTPPRGTLPDKVIFLGQTTGQMAIPAMQSGRKQRDDRFTITIICAVASAGESDGETSDTAVWGLFQSVDSILADDPKLGSTVTGLHHAVLGRVDGPDPDPFELGFASVVIAEIDCYSRSS